jgi:hypothetical protein
MPSVHGQRHAGRRNELAPARLVRTCSPGLNATPNGSSLLYSAIDQNRVNLTLSGSFAEDPSRFGQAFPGYRVAGQLPIGWA